MKKFLNLVLSLFSRPEINEEELIDYISARSSISRENVTLILDLEIQFLKDKNIAK